MSCSQVENCRVWNKTTRWHSAANNCSRAVGSYKRLTEVTRFANKVTQRLGRQTVSARHLHAGDVTRYWCTRWHSLTRESHLPSLSLATKFKRLNVYYTLPARLRSFMRGGTCVSAPPPTSHPADDWLQGGRALPTATFTWGQRLHLISTQNAPFPPPPSRPGERHRYRWWSDWSMILGWGGNIYVDVGGLLCSLTPSAVKGRNASVFSHFSELSLTQCSVRTCAHTKY